MQPTHLPVHLVIESPQRLGHDGKEMAGLCLLVLVLAWLTGHQLERTTLLLLGGGLIAGLAMWTTKAARFRGRKIEILVESDFISFSRHLLKHPNLWPQFKNGNLVRIPWHEILRWDFTDPDRSLRWGGWYPTEYTLRIRSTPGTLLVLDREPLLEVEDQFIPLVQQIQHSHGHEFYGLES